MKTPKTTKEALISEMLGDLDNILERIETAQKSMHVCEKNLSKLYLTVNQSKKTKFIEILIASFVCNFLFFLVLFIITHAFI